MSKRKRFLKTTSIIIFLFAAGAIIISGVSLSSGLRTKLTYKDRKVTTVARSKTMDSKFEKNSVHQQALDIVHLMSDDEKVAQLFIVLPEALITDENTVVQAGEVTRRCFNNKPVGGFIYLERNLQTPEQVRKLLSNVTEISKQRIGLIPFLCVDEEGGEVVRIAGRNEFGIDAIPSMVEVTDKEHAYQIGQEIGAYLNELGFNCDFAPVADVLINPSNELLKSRSFGFDTADVSQKCAAYSKGINENGILSCYKHFPGHGATVEDSHSGFAVSHRTIEELQASELVPFEQGIQKEVQMIMVGHIALPEVTGDNVPSSLSDQIMERLLRKEMGYQGLIITDALNMGAITKLYSSAEAAIMALNAGADIVLMPDDFQAAYQGVLSALQTGELDEKLIDKKLIRIVERKLLMKEQETQ